MNAAISLLYFTGILVLCWIVGKKIVTNEDFRKLFVVVLVFSIFIGLFMSMFALGPSNQPGGEIMLGVFIISNPLYFLSQLLRVNVSSLLGLFVLGPLSWLMILIIIEKIFFDKKTIINKSR